MAVIETKPGNHVRTKTTITIKFDTELFKNDSNGRIVFFGIAVCEKSQCGGEFLVVKKRYTYKGKSYKV